MQLVFTSFPETMFFIVFVSAIAILLYTFGALILKERRGNASSVNCVTEKQVDNYLRNKGYVVCNITPVKNSNQWLAFLVKNGQYLTATVSTKGEHIEEYFDSLE
jgi:hypothetical protein